MIRIVDPIITSVVGRMTEVAVFLSLNLPPEPAGFPAVRRSIVTVDKPVGPDQPNQATDVLLVRFMLNLVAGSDRSQGGVWQKRFPTVMPHDPKFDKELGRRIRVYQEAGGHRLNLKLSEPAPSDLTIASFVKQGEPTTPFPAIKPPEVKAQEALFTDSIIDPCRQESDRGARSKRVYSIVHLNYQLLLSLRAMQSGRLAPKLVRFIDLIDDPKLAPLRTELVEVERRDPNRPPIPSPGPIVI